MVASSGCGTWPCARGRPSPDRQAVTIARPHSRCARARAPAIRLPARSRPWNLWRAMEHVWAVAGLPSATALGSVWGTRAPLWSGRHAAIGMAGCPLAMQARHRHASRQPKSPAPSAGRSRRIPTAPMAIVRHTPRRKVAKLLLNRCQPARTTEPRHATFHPMRHPRGRRRTPRPTRTAPCQRPPTSRTPSRPPPP